VQKFGAGHRRDARPKVRFARDSALEGGGFEPSVPGRETVKPSRGNEPSCLEKRADLFWNRRFESTSLQRGVRNEPSPEVMLVSPIFRDLPILLGRVRIPVRHPQPAKSQAGPEGNAEDPRNHTSSPVWRDFRRVAR
jgi:hypothetical protein